MLQVEQARSWFALAHERLAQAKEQLNQLDAAAGDGDHGTTITRAFRAGRQSAKSGDELGAVFDAASEALATSAGGAIGPLLAAFFAEGGTIFQGREQVDTAAVADFFSRGLEATAQVGGAQPGDKTLLDALAPAAAALGSRREEPLATAMISAAEAADDGAQATQGMVAQRGRARFVGARAQSVQDAGATSMAIIIGALGDVLAGETASPLDLKPTPDSASPPPGKLVNHPDTMIEQELEGLALAHPLLKMGAPGVLTRTAPKETGRVGLAIGHGGGHTPSMAGFVGPGLLDADAYGELFTCASGVRIAEAIRLADRGAGVVLCISNHAGDVLNARLALRRAEQNGNEVRGVLLGDDIATAPRERLQDRRGLGGMLFAVKIGGAAAEQGASLDEVVRLMEKTNERTASLMVALRPPTHPATGQPLFTLPPGQIEVGSGVHGEPGVYQGAHLPADDLIDLLLDKLIPDIESLLQGKRVLVFVNGAGGTSMMELHILYRRVHHNLHARGIDISGSVVGSFFTTQDMGGFSLSLCAVDDEMLTLWDAPARGPFIYF